QHYADFAAQICRVNGQDSLQQRDFDNACETLTHIILKGCGLHLPA
ncbi:MAG TPA: TetR family transcriptional regulator C-terminal domain-containing protein, partial [Pseudomonas sp.]|nr:TetR family transcriptional regulator C-terminal domain-containing protein [Pseudomonas sp.]